MSILVLVSFCKEGSALPSIMVLFPNPDRIYFQAINDPKLMRNRVGRNLSVVIGLSFIMNITKFLEATVSLNEKDETYRIR